MKAVVCGLMFVLMCTAVFGGEQASIAAVSGTTSDLAAGSTVNAGTTGVLASSDSVIAPLASSDSALRVPPGFRAKEGTTAEPYTNTGWAKEVIHEKTGIEMVFIPAGEFQMGSPDSEKGHDKNEGPVHTVRITKPFYLGKYEVTNAQYRLYKPSHNGGAYMGLSLDGDKQPVADVSWNDAKAYCDWADLVLPTEAQWEYSCRAGSKGSFWWGDSDSDAGHHANVADTSAKTKWPDWTAVETDDGYAVTAPVGNYDANAFGLYDVIGNVWEWCADWYGPYVAGTAVDPQGPPSGTERDLRGGSWRRPPRGCRSARRRGSDLTTMYDGVGFRMARGL